MDVTRVIDELIDSGFQALEIDDPVAFMEWRRRVAVALGPDHVYTQLFQGAVDNKGKNSALASKSIPTIMKQTALRNERVA
jgi:hypothetical protein